jgi:RNAse (barnase) inhibitor barstar
MTNIQSIAAGQGAPLVYYWPTPSVAEQFAQSVAERGGRCFLLDGTRMTEPTLLMQEFARSLEFPDYFGHNWDALEDCLGDLGWLDERLTHFVIWIDRWEHCASPMLLEVLEQAVTLWADEVTPLYVLLSGDRQGLTTLPQIQ